jgi:hypothetical protein
MRGASMSDMFQIRNSISKLPVHLRKILLRSLGKYCAKCGRTGIREAHGYGVTSFSCEGTKADRHERAEWEAEA